MSPRYVYDMSMTLLNIRVWHRSNEQQFQIFVVSCSFTSAKKPVHDLFLQPWVALLIATKQNVKKNVVSQITKYLDILLYNYIYNI